MKFLIYSKGRYGYISPVPTGKIAATLSKYLSYERLGKKFMPNPAWATVKLYNTNTGRFPWGLLYLVKEIIMKCGEESLLESYKIVYKSLPNADVSGWNAKLRSYQKEAILELLDNDGGILCMPPGSGKTFTILEYLRIMQQKALVIVPTLDLVRQWQEQISEDYIHVINYQNKKAVELIKQANIIVFDECHMVSAKTVYTLAMNASENAITVGCSATPYRNDNEDLKIFAGVGPIVYVLDRQQLIKKGFLVDAIVKYVKLEGTCDDFALSYSDIYENGIVNNVERNNVIELIACSEVGKNKKVLILVNRIDHGQYFYDELRSICNTIYLHGGVKDRDVDFDYYNIIIATSIFDEGIDLPAFDVLILAGGGKSSVKLIQRVGRVLRPFKNKDHAVVYDFMDKGKYLSQHYRQRRKLLEKEFKVEELK